MKNRDARMRNGISLRSATASLAPEDSSCLGKALSLLSPPTPLLSLRRGARRLAGPHPVLPLWAQPSLYLGIVSRAANISRACSPEGRPTRTTWTNMPLAALQSQGPRF